MTEPIRQWLVRPDTGGGVIKHGTAICIRFTGQDGENLDVILPYEGLHRLMLGIHKLSHEARLTRIAEGLPDEGFQAYSDTLLAVESLTVHSSVSDPARMMLQLETKSGMSWSLFLAPIQAQSLWESLGRFLKK